MFPERGRRCRRPSPPATAAVDRATATWPTFRSLIGVLAQDRPGRLAGLGLLIMISAGAPLVGPQVVRLFIDAAITGASVSMLGLLAAGYLAAALAQQALSLAAGMASSRVALGAADALRERVTAHVLDLDLSFHDGQTPGELIERTDGDAGALSAFLSSFLVQVVGNVITLLGVLTLVLLDDGRIGLAMLAFVIIAAVVIMKLRHLAVPSAIEQRAASADLVGVIEEGLRGTEDLRANAGGGYQLGRFRAAQARLLEAGLRSATASRTTWMITGGVFAAGTVLSLLGGALLYQAGMISLGVVYLLFRYTSLLRDPLDAIAEQQQLAQQAIAGFARIGELLALRPAIRSGGRTTLPTGPLALRLDRVHFAYPGRGRVLHGLDLELEPGSVLGLVGHTGAGKTTLARLLVRLQDPTGGTIRVGGVELGTVSLADLRRRITLVTQDVQLFQATVRENLTLFGSHPARERTMIDILGDLGLEPWLRSLPAGLDSRLEPGGAGVSAGEAQLIAFARAFLRDPGLVIMDEATSRLDPVTELRIERAVDRLLAERSAVVIAHRLSTLERADQIAVLDAGRIVEYGERRSLVAAPAGRFVGLLRTAADGVLP
ncbi:ABC transporter ATP-binding protein [Microlunatus sp. GCM10028923]|uniref:ABC transporter ATP-binding protein n=1 Tax=Microlunatus sp. GCM10028923 TaxID=3273400 RepID=UPI00362023F6